MARYESALDLIGNTPMVDISSLSPNPRVAIVAKLEGWNPGGSVKDRAAKSMVEEAEKDGALRPGQQILESSSGNTGIALAMIAAVRGYRLILVMPSSFSVERRQVLAAYGAELVLTPAEKGMRGAVAGAEALLAEHPGAFMPQQFRNPANPEVHRLTTGPEIWAACDGQVDAFVSGVGTGGTVTGAGGLLKERRPGLWIAGVEPAASPVLSGGKPGPHPLQGIGPGFVPEVLNRDLLDEVICVEAADALATVRQLASREGILAGPSSGAAVYAAAQVASRPQFQGKTVVVILPDTGERYLSTGIFPDPTQATGAARGGPA